jgi:glycosyl transferase, family 25
MPIPASDAPPMKNQFDTLFDCFVISLKRQPDRLQAFRDRNKPAKIDFKHFEAIDGAQSNAADLDGIVAKGATNYTPGAVGVAMSHLALWRHCTERNNHLVVCEDDAVLRHDIKERLSSLAEGNNWDVILLGYNMDAAFELKIAPGIDFGGGFSVRFPTAKHLADFANANDSVGLQRLNIALGLCGYAVTSKGAQFLIRSCFPMDNRPVLYRSYGHSIPAYGLDCVMATLYPRMRAYACVPPLVMTPNDHKTSTIQRRVGP